MAAKQLDSTTQFESREYQVELYTQALKENLILYLPTGSGKTYIATLLIKHFNANNDFRSISDNGKRTFFLVNTVALVQQQATHIRSQTVYNVGTYSGDMGVDVWEHSIWQDELNTKHVLIMTAQILLDLLSHNKVSLKNINLLIFDECHRAVSNHPMRQIMKTFQFVDVTQQPRVLGLTATLLNGNTNAEKLPDEIRELEVTFLARIATSVNEEMVQMYSTNPKVQKVTYTENTKTPINCYAARDTILSNFTRFVDLVEIEEKIVAPTHLVPHNVRRIDDNSKKTNKRLKNLVQDIQANMDDLGVYGGSLTMLAHMVQVHQMTPNVQSENARLLYQSVITECTLLRKFFDIEMRRSNLSEKDILYRFSSDKVVKLCNIFKILKGNDSAIVFVKRRFTAKIMYYLTKSAAANDPKLSHIKSNFIVGYNVGNPFKDTRENYLQRHQNTKIMNKFNQGELNVLFASNVVEEGIDITRCNYVIMFDLPQDFRSYIQSKGRARDRESKYIFMLSQKDHNFEGRRHSYTQIEEKLKELLHGGKAQFRKPPSEMELNETLYLETPGLEPFRPLGSDGPVVTALSAITLINRYLTSLKHDKFTKICPFWYIEEKATNHRCHLQLPLESKIIEILKGEWMPNAEDAKRSVALVAARRLYEMGSLHQQSLLPLTLKDIDLNLNSYTPRVPVEEIKDKKIEDSKKVNVGTKKHKRLVEKEWPDCLCNCRPHPQKEAYLHVLNMQPQYIPPPGNHRLEVVHRTLSLPNTFAILSTKLLPPVAPFPMYMSTGDLEVTLNQSCPIRLDKDQLRQIEEFHFTLFDKVVTVAKSFMVTDRTNKANSYLIAPVTLGVQSQYTIDWEVIHQARQPFPSPIKAPTKEERNQLNVTIENYLLRIVSPWYRTVPTQRFLVTEVCENMTEATSFPSDNYKSYKDYYFDKYKLEPMKENQPLIEVRTLSSHIKSTKPRALTKALKNKKKDENEDYEVWLLPEFCVVYPFPGQYWLKAELLPSVLYRISRLCIADQLRSSIALATGVGIVQLPPGKSWRALEEDKSLSNKDDAVGELTQALKPLTMMARHSSPAKSTKCVWGDEEEPLDIERCMDSVSIFDIINYSHFIHTPLLGVEALAGSVKKSRSELTSVKKQPVLKMVDPPILNMLKRNAILGPEQVEIMQALTAASAHDLVDCERFETLGDSFLKFAISLTLFECNPDYQEGHLTHIKGRVVGNKNLYHCGQGSNLGGILEIQNFLPREDWVPPGFWVDVRMKNALHITELDPACLYDLRIPEEDRISGILSDHTIEAFNDILLEANELQTPRTCSFLNQLALTDKNIADSVEAILGVYLKSCGLVGALKVMNWFEVINPSMSTPDIFSRPPAPAAKSNEDPGVHLQFPHQLEEILNYKFKDRAFMLQALTHPSYTRNNITLFYQRLEFLGDALIDFLITVHIFEKCEKLCPGDLTDLRSALVNNITLGALSVRHQFYKFMLAHSSKLNDCLMRFVNHQENRSHVIDDDILFLVEEKEINISESIDVPKALGDIFEALIGAIYLDSGKNLDVVWKIVYNLMHKEIESFHKNIPKNTVRMLYETDCCPVFSSVISSDGAIMVTVEVTINGKRKRFNGFGDNKQDSKRAAAKHALRAFRSQAN